MGTLLVGNGKMGELILKELMSDERAGAVTVCDLKYTEDHVKDGVAFTGSLDRALLNGIDRAFVATPADTHAHVLARLLENGVKKIYVEKPAVVGKAELDEVRPLAKGARLAVGYILRQSDATAETMKRFEELTAGGYRLELASVSYQKYLPATFEERAMYDLGVFDETVHVWDLIFNCLGLSANELVFSDCVPEMDPEKPDRCIAARLYYLIRTAHDQALINVDASFRCPERRREFFFTFKNSDGKRKSLLLTFDSADGTDSLDLIDGDTVTRRFEWPALVKLSRQIKQTFDFFETGERGRLASFEESETINRFFALTGLYK